MQHTGTEPVQPVAHHVNGMEYWRSLEQLADAPAMRDMISKEFPGYDADGILTGSRRRFLKLMGASLALAGLTLNGCRRWPQEKLAPYSSNPRGRTPGVPEQYATLMELGGVAAGLLVTSFDGRPIKIEGNPSHPFARTGKVGSTEYGAADALAQATVLEVYDPHRSTMVKDRSNVTTSRSAEGDGPEQAPARNGEKDSTWDAFTTFASNHFSKLKGNGEGFAILSEATLSPSVLDMKARLLGAFPQARWFEYEPLSRDSEIEASKLAFGQAVRTVLHLDQASTVLLLDADVLGEHPAHIRYAADWAVGRRSADASKNATMSRVYMAETGFSITGTVADVRLPVDPSRLYVLARAIAAKLGVGGVEGEEKLTKGEEEFVTTAAKDLKESGKKSVVVAGPSASVHAQALAHAMNEKLGAVGTTVTLVEDPAGDRPNHLKDIADLAAAIKASKVSTLLIIGGNPAYDAPADLAFGKLLASVPVSIRLGLYDDETSQLCKWQLPRAHYLESWGDARAWDGTVGLVQPLILPLYGGKSAIELLALLINEKNGLTAGDQIVRRTWHNFIPGAQFDHQFRRTLAEGVLVKTTFKPVAAKVKLAAYPVPTKPVDGKFIRFQSHGSLYDGRFATNGWLQETPESITKLMWDNAALLSKQDADSLGVTTGDMIRVRSPRGIELSIAAYVLPGQPVGVIGLPLGYGRTAAGPVGNLVGFNTFELRDSGTPWVTGGAVIGHGEGKYPLVSTQDHHIMDAMGASARDKRVGARHESGEIIHETTFADFVKDPHSARGGRKSIPLQLFDPPHDFKDTHQWGMSVDMNSCIGCNACIVACQAENNIPIVGKDEASNHRAMHWIRIDRYFKGKAEDPGIEVVYQPMMCQHCENAPCEQVCPVAATMHDSEGLNTMVYNRCIGTRYCSNNCPYKVRRFNYFDYHSKDPRNTAESYLNLPDQQQLNEVDKVKRMVFNPEVTVRMRGVMEKCTFCVQRIHTTVTQKRNAGGDVVDGDILTACQQSCPTQAIIFGNLNEAGSQVVKNHNNVRTYGVLHDELDTRPRTKYLAKLRNPVEETAAAISAPAVTVPAEHG